MYEISDQNIKKEVIEECAKDNISLQCIRITTGPNITTI
jgi:hypothetical protein